MMIIFKIFNKNLFISFLSYFKNMNKNFTLFQKREKLILSDFNNIWKGKISS